MSSLEVAQYTFSFKMFLFSRFHWDGREAFSVYRFWNKSTLLSPEMKILHIISELGAFYILADKHYNACPWHEKKTKHENFQKHMVLAVYSFHVSSLEWVSHERGTIANFIRIISATIHIYLAKFANFVQILLKLQKLRKVSLKHFH